VCVETQRLRNTEDRDFGMGDFLTQGSGVAEKLRER
jgi:hypothetical protein